MGATKKYCKCGHENKDHMKNPHSKWSLKNYCRSCPCNSYLNRERPFKSDYAVAILSIVFAAFVIILSYVLIVESDPALTGIENEQITMTNRQAYESMVLFIILGNVLFICWFAISPILDVIYYKKRKEFPIQDENDKL